MTAQLAPDRFRFRVDLLPGETVLWEGGADRASLWPRLIVYGFLIVAFAAFLTLPAALAAYLDRHYPIDAPAAQASSVSAQPTERAAAPAKPARDAKAERRARAELFAFTTMVLVWAPLLLGGLYVDGRLRQRNAWYVVTSERVCIQSGALTIRLATLDLDRIVTVQGSATWLERRFGLETIELSHAGVNVHAQGQRVLGNSTIAIAGVRRGTQVLTHLLSEWLPRDGRRRHVEAGAGAA